MSYSHRNQRGFAGAAVTCFPDAFSSPNVCYSTGGCPATYTSGGGAPLPPVEYSTHPLGSCGYGAVPSPNGFFENVLFVNGLGSFVHAQLNEPLLIELRHPLLVGAGGSLPIHIEAYIGEPSANDVFPISPSIGSFCFMPCAVQATGLNFTLASSYSLASRCGPLTSSSGSGYTYSIPTGFGFPMEFVLQGLIEIAPGDFRVTNAVAVTVQ